MGSAPIYEIVTAMKKQENIPVGCVLSLQWPSPGQGCLPGGCLPRGVCLAGCLPGRVYTSDVNRMTDRCKNITFPQLRLRTVIIAIERCFIVHTIAITIVPLTAGVKAAHTVRL